MAAQKLATDQHTIMATFTDEEHDLLEAFAAEQGIEDLSAAIPALLHELVRLHDQLWDAHLTTLPEALVTKGNAALKAYEGGQTEELDTDTP